MQPVRALPNSKLKKVVYMQGASNVSYLILSSVRVPRLVDSCWMSDRRTGWMRGHGCWPKTCWESMVSHTYRTRFKSAADKAWRKETGKIGDTDRERESASNQKRQGERWKSNMEEGGSERAREMKEAGRE